MHLLVNGTRQPLAGEIPVPPSKYHAHRALVLASLADGTSRIRGVSENRQIRYTVTLLRGLGVGIRIKDDCYVVHGTGGHYPARRTALSAGNSGTTLYFMTGLASLADRPVTINGQKYFRRRPMGPQLEALRRMGVRLDAEENRTPIRVEAHRPCGGRVRVPGTLSQWISGLLLLAPFATGPTTIEVTGQLNERPYLELTVAMMRRFGLRVRVADDWRRFDVEPGQQAVATDLTLPPDIGSAAFGIAAAALHRSDVLLRGMDRAEGGSGDHPEFHFLDVARRMGVPMTPEEGGLRVRHDGSPLKAVDVDCRDMPDMLPVLATMATFATGESVFRNVAHTRLKESDRAAAMLQLNAMGGDLDLSGSTLRVRGTGRLRGARLSSFNDHRIQMALAVAATAASGCSTLTYPRAHRTSYPAFVTAMNSLGLSVSTENESIARRTRSHDRRPIHNPDHAARSTLPQWLRRRAADRPDGLALVELRAGRDDRLTWRELAERVDRTATMLLRSGVTAGDNVAYQLPNRAEFVVISLAVLRIGAVCCPVMPFLRERELAQVLRQSGARVLFVTDRHGTRRPAEELAQMPARERGRLSQVYVLPEDVGPAGIPVPTADLTWHDWEQALADTAIDQDALAACEPTPESTAQLLFTSGTTGEPKGVVHSSGHLVRAAAMEIRHLGLGAQDTVWVPSPLAHQTGFLYGMVLALVLGVPQILQGEWETERALRALDEHGATFVQAATPFLADLVKAVKDSGRTPRRLRIFVATGATVPRGLAARAGRVLQAAVCGAFGTTETCLAALSAPGDEPARRSGTDGRALDGVELRITDGGRLLPPGLQGCLEVRSPTLFTGYLDRPELTADAFTEDGWYRTGDLATMDAAGFLCVTGRVKDIINRGGEKIPVAEVEQLLFEHPAVEDVAVVAMPDRRLGERACAFVVLGTQLSFAGMQRYLEERRLAKQYWPERLEPVDALPRNPIGKVEKFALRERARGLRPHPVRRSRQSMQQKGTR
ncbi:3-phosphoshikimate 1-carboxyvinyltransferase [Streptomyces gamaensis]|uniref:3-phosphoshikimate 1-carboxyvinyltransferase n=1 Tax=Streptomyces gamaensis TaxID=1763542 RepID=A0ABW0Z754_9ACTN